MLGTGASEEETPMEQVEAQGRTGVAGLSRRQFVGTVAAGGLLAGAAWLAPGMQAEANPAGEGTFAVRTPVVVPEPEAGASRKAIEPYATPSVTYAAKRDAAVKRVLVVVDYQVDFVSGGVFGDIVPALAIEEALCEKIRTFQEAGDIVIYTMDTHPDDDYENTREATVNPPHCVPGTPGWEVYGRARELLTPETAILVMKGTYGSVDLPYVVENIRRQGVRVESIELAGVSTTCRVLHNAILLYNFFPELPIILDEQTTASYTDERTAHQLLELESWGFTIRRK